MPYIDPMSLSNLRCFFEHGFCKTKRFESIEHAQILVFVRFGDICSFCHPSGGFNDVFFQMYCTETREEKQYLL